VSVVDVEAIRQLTARFCRLCDTQQWERCSELLSADAICEVAGQGPVTGPRAWRDAAARTLAGATTVHQLHMPEIEITGPDSAHGLGAITSYIEFPSRATRVGHQAYDRYETRYRRERDGWKIASLRMAPGRRDGLAGGRPPEVPALRLGDDWIGGTPSVATVEELVEFEAIMQLKARYFRLLDTKDWREWRHLFADGARFELMGVSGDISTPDHFTATVRAMLHGTVTVHHGHAPELRLIDERRARGIWALNDYVDYCAASQGIRGFGHYEEEYVKSDRGWQIASLRLSYLRLDGFSAEPWVPPALSRVRPDFLDGGVAADAARLEDLEAIRRLKARYFRLMDAKDWDAMRGVFTGDARITTPRMGGGSEDLETFMSSLPRQLTDATTVHHGHMPEIVFTGDDGARGIWALFDYLEWPEGHFPRAYRGYGHYEEHYRREADGWKIERLRLSRLREDVTGA
jgi:ketosteroid isomerase-like protein